MSTETTRRLVEGFVTARASGDREAVMRLLADDVALYPPPSTGLGPFHGPGEVVNALSGEVLAKALDVGTVQRTLHRIIADGDLGIVLNRLEATSLKGQPYANEYCFVFACGDDVIIRIDEFTDTLRADAIFHFADAR